MTLLIIQMLNNDGVVDDEGVDDDDDVDGDDAGDSGVVALEKPAGFGFMFPFVGFSFC